MIWQSKDDVSVAKWKDKRPVLMKSNAHVPNLTNVTNRRGQEKQKPNLVKDYSDCMSGVDRSDQMMSYHSGLRKTVRWYKKAGVYFLEIFLTSTYYLYRKFSTDNEFKHQLDFKENVIKSLIGERKRKKHMEPTADFHYLEPSLQEIRRNTQQGDASNVGKQTQERNHVFYVDFVRINHHCVYTHVSIFIISSLALWKTRKKSLMRCQNLLFNF